MIWVEMSHKGEFPFSSRLIDDLLRYGSTCWSPSYWRGWVRRKTSSRLAWDPWKTLFGEEEWIHEVHIRLLHCKVLHWVTLSPFLFPFSSYLSSESKLIYVAQIPHVCLVSKEANLQSLGKGVQKLHNLFGVLLQRIAVSSFHLFIQSIIYLY